MSSINSTSTLKSQTIIRRNLCFKAKYINARNWSFDLHAVSTFRHALFPHMSTLMFHLPPRFQCLLHEYLQPGWLLWGLPKSHLPHAVDELDICARSVPFAARDCVPDRSTIFCGSDAYAALLVILSSCYASVESSY